MLFECLQGFQRRPILGRLLPRLIFFVLLSGISLSPVRAETALPEKALSEKSVLILYSYFASTPAYTATTAPLLSTLIDAGVMAGNLHQEYLDLGRHGDLEYRRRLQEFLKHKYSTVKFDLVVTLHGAAQQFVLQDGKNLWPDAQWLFLLAPGIPEPNKIGRTSGVELLKLDFRGTLERALEMFPKTRRVVFVTGSGPPELKYVEQAKAAFGPWRDSLAFEYTVGQSLGEIVARVAKLPPDTIVLASALITDGRGANLIVAEATRDVAQAANAPVFGFYDSVMGTGVVGGSMVSFEKIGAHAGKLAVDVLGGKIALADPPLILPSLPPAPMFDWPQIVRWRGDVARLPEDSGFLNRPLTLWGQYKAAVISTLVVFLILAGLIQGLLRQNHRRRVAEQSARKSEEKYRALIETTGTGYLILDRDGKVVDANPEYVRLTGHDELRDILGKPVTEWTASYDQERNSMAVAECVATGLIRNFVIDYANENGRTTPIEINASAVGDGGSLQIVSLCRNVTERVRAEQAIKESYDRLVGVLNSLDAIVYVADMQTYELLFVNKVVADTVGDIAGQPCWKTLQTGQSGPCAFCTNNKLLDAAGNPTGIYHWELQNTVNQHWYDVRDRAIRWTDGRLVRMEIATDITERKQAEESLRAGEEKNRALIQRIHTAVVVHGPDTRILTCNPMAQELLGLTEDQMLGKTAIDPAWHFRHEDGTAMRVEEYPVNQVIGRRQALRDLVIEVRRPGKQQDNAVWVLVNADPVFVNESEIAQVIVTFIDITKHKQAEREILRSNAELEQFSYAISHDMRQPLRMISSYMHLLEEDLAGQLDAEKREFFGFAIDGARRMDAMMVGLLEYSRVGRKGEPPTWIESRSLLDDALLFLHPSIAETQAAVRIEGNWPRIHASPDEILRLLQNLIGNALKFRVEGRKPEIVLTSEMTSKEWLMCVADNGIGLHPDQIGRLFNVFQRLQSRTTYDGTGIGLALCRKIAEHHGGRIWAESAGEGQGSRFCVLLPQETAEAQ